MVVKGKIRCPNEYADGTKSVEIHFPKEMFDKLPAKPNQRVDIKLEVGEKTYMAGIRHTDRNSYIWISPDCEYRGAKVRLSDIIFNARFEQNDDILIDLSGNRACVILDDNAPHLNALLPEEIEDPENYSEGSVKTISVNAYERNSKARRKCIDHYGCTCVICGFNFGEVYGPEAEGLIHVHHVKPLSEVNEEYHVDPIVDLRPLCPNCHAFVHIGEKCRELEEITILKKYA